MIALLRKRWWKIVGVLILSYAIIGGLFIPLAPGIIQVSPSQVEAGTEQTFEVKGYNSHYAEGELPTILLKQDSIIYCAIAARALSDDVLEVKFNIPSASQLRQDKTTFDLIIDGEKDGTTFRRGAIIASGDKNEEEVELVPACQVDFSPRQANFISFPFREILYESIRNLFFHVPMWFGMTLIMFFSFAMSITYLANGKMDHDLIAKEAAAVGLFLGFLGAITGATWANFTWGEPWPNDPRTNSAAVGILIYLAYFVLRGSLTNELSRAKVSAVYGVFAFVLFIVFIFVLPRMTTSVHPGAGGNPGFKQYDLDNTMRPIFYSAVFGYTLLGMWIISLRVRYGLMKQQLENEN